MANNYNILRTVDIKPGTNIVDVFKGSGYTFNTAIADIIDNSLTALSKNISINFHFHGKNSFITIQDDGYGMDEKVIENALLYGGKSIRETRELTDTGRFSVGLKTAASRFAKRLTVVSKGSEGQTNSYLIDFKRLTDTNLWEAFKIENRDDFSIKSKTGTIIILEELMIENDERSNEAVLVNQDSFLKYIGSLEKHLSKTYYYYIKNGTNITINGVKVKGWCPFKVGNTKAENAYVTTVYNEPILVNGSKVQITGYVLPPLDSLNPDQVAYVKGSDKSMITSQGFYFYRGNRLISSGGWLDIEGLESDMKYNYARIGIFVDNTLDDYLGVNFMKNTIDPPQEFSQSLISIAKKVRSAALKSYNVNKDSRPYDKRKHKLVSPWIVKHTSKGMKLTINKDHPTIQLILDGIDIRKKEMLFNLLEKNIPVGEIQNFDRVDCDFNDDEIFAMLEDLYNDLYSKNKTFDEIKDIIVGTEPFFDDKYQLVTFKFLNGKQKDER